MTTSSAGKVLSTPLRSTTPTLFGLFVAPLSSKLRASAIKTLAFESRTSSWVR
jgi:hypothetical protein